MFDPDPVRVTLDLARPATPAGESVDVIVRLINTSGRAGPFDGIAPEDQTIWFEMVSPDGSTACYSYNDALVRRGDPPEAHADPAEHMLAPGEALEQPYQLCQFTGHLAPGEYVVRALYLEGFAASEAVHLTITAPRPFEVVRSTWDFDRTALSHLVSISVAIDGFGRSNLFWLEEGARYHEFLFHHHALITRAGSVDPLLSHTFRYLQDARHLLWRESGSAMRAHLVRDGAIASQPVSIHPPAGARILDATYTTEDGDLEVFAASAPAGLDVMLWRGLVTAAGSPRWTPIVEIESPDRKRDTLETPVVRLSYDALHHLHAVVVQPARNVVYYLEWDAELQVIRQFSDVFARRTCEDLFIHHHWKVDAEEFPPPLETAFGLLFRGPHEDRRWDLWRYVPDGKGGFARERNGRTVLYPEDLMHIDAVVDRVGQLHLLWQRHGAYYYSRLDAPHLVALARPPMTLYPQLLIEGDPAGEGGAVTCRYRDTDGAFRFHAMETALPQVLELVLPRESVAPGEPFEVDIVQRNMGVQTILVPALSAADADLTFTLRSEAPPRPEVLLRPADGSGAETFSLAEAGPSEVWTELPPDAASAGRARLHAPETAGRYALGAQVAWSGVRAAEIWLNVG